MVCDIQEVDIAGPMFLWGCSPRSLLRGTPLTVPVSFRVKFPPIVCGSWCYFTRSLVSRSDFQKKSFFDSKKALSALLLPPKSKSDFSSPQLFWQIPKSLLSSAWCRWFQKDPALQL